MTVAVRNEQIRHCHAAGCLASSAAATSTWPTQRERPNGLVAPDSWPKLMWEAIPADTARSR